MTQRYTGLPDALKQAVFARDQYRCRWCGSTNRYGYDVHHIQYRRGYSYDVIDNLVTLCRDCHGFVHDSYQIAKADAQHILTRVISADGAGSTGMAGWRALRNEKPPEENSGPGVGRLLHLD